MSHQVTSLLQRYPPLPQSPHAAPSSHQEPTGISELFFSTCSKILGAYPADQPARLVTAPPPPPVSLLFPFFVFSTPNQQFNANLESIRPEIEQVLQVQPSFHFCCTASSILGI